MNASDSANFDRREGTWYAPGDINAFFGLVLDNIAGLILLVGLLSASFGFPQQFALHYLVPGTAVGVFVGDIIFFVMARKLARTLGNPRVTAMPLGIDTPSTFGMVFFVLGPSFLHATENLQMTPEDAARYTWHIGIWSLVASGIFKALCAPFSGAVRRYVPRAGLLGSLAAIALVLISFMPLLEILQYPLVGLVALSIVLMTLVGRVPLPGRTPGALAALLVAGLIFYLCRLGGVPGYVHTGESLPVELFPAGWLGAFQFDWLNDAAAALPYLPVVLPFALATVVGGIDCTESAAAAGDEFPTNQIIGAEAFATLVAGLCGGVIQTTPYIGHPAYKAMGGRSGYVLATAIVVGFAGVSGLFAYFYEFIPPPTVYPILVFIGLEISAQSFLATPRQHYPAVALACIPALAFLAVSFPNQLLGDATIREAGISEANLANPELAGKLLTLRMLSNGFILTSLVWASALAAMVDRKLMIAGLILLLCAGLTLFGIIHSPRPDAAIFLPIELDGLEAWQLDDELRGPVFRYAGGYALSGFLIMLFALSARSFLARSRLAP